jgi:transposase
MDGVVEIITGRERRRRWSVEDKLRIVAETQAAGEQVRAVAARNGLCESLVYTWRRQAREGVLVSPEIPTFMAVRTLEAPNPAALPAADPERTIELQAPVTSQASPSGMIEIELRDGRRIRVGNDVNVVALRRVLQALQT